MDLESKCSDFSQLNRYFLQENQRRSTQHHLFVLKSTQTAEATGSSQAAEDQIMNSQNCQQRVACEAFVSFCFSCFPLCLDFEWVADDRFHFAVMLWGEGLAGNLLRPAVGLLFWDLF